MDSVAPGDRPFAEFICRCEREGRTHVEGCPPAPKLVNITASPPFEEIFARHVSDMRAIMLAKLRLRGTANITAQGLRGVIERMALDKLERIRRSVLLLDFVAEAQRRGYEVKTEDLLEAEDARTGLVDDIRDVANYAIIALCLLEGSWGAMPGGE